MRTLSVRNSRKDSLAIIRGNALVSPPVDWFLKLGCEKMLLEVNVLLLLHRPDFQRKSRYEMTS